MSDVVPKEWAERKKRPFFEAATKGDSPLMKIPGRFGTNIQIWMLPSLVLKSSVLAFEDMGHLMYCMNKR